MLDEFISYLKEQVGQPYVWGGQHTKLTPSNYISVIHKKEQNRGGYKDGPSYEQAAIDFCKKKFDAGADVLYAYDCSGLGVYWLQNVKHFWTCDVNANTMMGRCVDLDTPEPPEKGWWVFRLDGKRASHIGYMIDNEYLIEAKGRKYGVVKTKWREKDWDCWGIPKIFEEEIRASVLIPEPDPVEPEDPAEEHELFVKVLKGKSVNVRTADSKKGRILFTAHGNDTFPLIGIAPSGWYNIETKRGPAYITNKEKYTIVI